GFRGNGTDQWRFRSLLVGKRAVPKDVIQQGIDVQGVDIRDTLERFGRLFNRDPDAAMGVEHGPEGAVLASAPDERRRGLALYFHPKSVAARPDANLTGGGERAILVVAGNTLQLDQVATR